MGGVTGNEAVLHQAVLDGAKRSLHALVVGRKEADQRNHEQARIELLGPEILDEGAELSIEPLTANGVVNFAPDPSPSIHRAFAAELLHRADGAIEGDPCHDLGVGKVPAWSAHFPNAFVGL